MRRIYLDYAASTPVDPRVFKAMRPYFGKYFGNPGSLHSFGQMAMAAVDVAREAIARALGADFREIIFTGSATEANNLAIQGAVSGFRKKFPDRTPEIIVSSIEHESVLETARAMQANGAKLKVLGVDQGGKVDPRELQDSLSKDTAVVSVMYGNNETGGLPPVPEIGALISNFRGINSYPLFHTDTAQAFQYLDCRPEFLNADLITISGHKLGGPKGIGALYIKEKYKTAVMPLIFGGGQEFGWRSATENVPLLAGFGKALELAIKERSKRESHVRKLKERFLKGVSRIKGVKIRPGGLPHILNFSLSGVDAPEILRALDLAGLAISTGAACSSRAFKNSHVLEAMKLPKKEIRGSFRVSFGKETNLSEIDTALKIMTEVLSRMNPR